MIELHVVALFPVVKRATDLDLMVSRAPIMQLERVCSSLLHHPIKLRWHYATLKLLSAFLRTEIDIVHLVQIALLCANYLLNNIDRSVHLRAPLAEETLCGHHLLEVDEYFLAHAAELLKPRDADSLAWHRRIEGILAEFGVLLRLPERANGPLNGEDEVLLLVRLKGVAAACLAVPLELDD